jgi:hypothetical protein
MTKIDWRNIEGETREFGPGMVELVLTARGEMVNVICHARQVPYVVPALKDWVLRDGPAEPPECEINESFTSSTEGRVAAPATHGQKAYRLAKELADHLAVTPAQPLTLNQIDAIENKVYMSTTNKGKPKYEYAVALVRAVEAAHEIKGETK